MLTFMPYYALILKTALTDVYDSQDKAMSNKLKNAANDVLQVI